MQETKIKVLKKRDFDFLYALAKVGVLTRSQAFSIQMNKSRLWGYKQDGYIQRSYVYNAKTKENEECFYLLKAGRELATNLLGIEKFFYVNGMNLPTKLADVFLDLNPSEQQTWLNPLEYKEILIEKGIAWSGKNKIPNGIYRIDEMLVFVEIKTRNRKPGEKVRVERLAKEVEAEVHHI